MAAKAVRDSLARRAATDVCHLAARQTELLAHHAVHLLIRLTGTGDRDDRAVFRRLDGILQRSILDVRRSKKNLALFSHNGHTAEIFNAERGVEQHVRKSAVLHRDKHSVATAGSRDILPARFTAAVCHVVHNELCVGNALAVDDLNHLARVDIAAATGRRAHDKLDLSIGLPAISSENRRCTKRKQKRCTQNTHELLHHRKPPS